MDASQFQSWPAHSQLLAHQGFPLMPAIHYSQTITKESIAKNYKPLVTRNKSLYTIHSSSEFWWTSCATQKISLTFHQKTTQLRDRWWNTKRKKAVSWTSWIWRIMSCTLFLFRIFLHFCTFLKRNIFKITNIRVPLNISN